MKSFGYKYICSYLATQIFFNFLVGLLVFWLFTFLVGHVGGRLTKFTKLRKSELELDRKPRRFNFVIQSVVKGLKISTGGVDSSFLGMTKKGQHLPIKPDCSGNTFCCVCLSNLIGFRNL